MKDKKVIREAILAALGSPESGVFVDYMDTIVNAVVGLDEYNPNARDGDGDGQVQDGTQFARPAKETRTVEAKEKR